MLAATTTAAAIPKLPMNAWPKPPLFQASTKFQKRMWSGQPSPVCSERGLLIAISTRLTSGYSEKNANRSSST